MRHSIHLIGILLAGTAMTGAPALAAEAPVGGEQGISDIVVTASRHEQNLQKVSASVSVIGGESLQDKAAANLSQIFDALPSVQTTAQPGGFSVNVRGMGGDLPAGTAQGASAVVIDGVYNVTSQGTTVGLFDVNRVEVLPGPQSTRYGPNADGGLVNIYTNDPKLNKLEGNAALTVGNYGLVRGEVAINVPLGEKLALRVAGAAISRDSYFHPAQGDQKGQSLRAKLLYKPNDALSLKLSYEVDHVGGAGNGSNVFPVLTNKVPVYAGDSINHTGDPWAQSPSNPVNTTHTSIYQHAFGASGSYDFDNGVALDAQGSYTMISGGETANIYLAPWSTTFAPFQNATLKEFDRFNQYTGEVRLHNGAGSKVLWKVVCGRPKRSKR
ncbi:outer membrane receptor protein involved in Fe transport [Novosphingobium sp. SG751A]|uniref:TonB-dependent receptor n=1 Tax=Novosphingobium sp. SG751A TaxID=2587000 RepID=UPI00155749E8|nr:TonB-dependent receptor plug domain-containing protein [Novosphingobium sp. SG751A]NOW48290.1 outer membrane receptor protein involved in Fe transport [Novosphingobium sp. SG751A]